MGVAGGDGGECGGEKGCGHRSPSCARSVQCPKRGCQGKRRSQTWGTLCGKMGSGQRPGERRPRWGTEPLRWAGPGRAGSRRRGAGGSRPGHRARPLSGPGPLRSGVRGCPEGAGPRSPSRHGRGPGGGGGGTPRVQSWESRSGAFQSLDALPSRGTGAKAPQPGEATTTAIIVIALPSLVTGEASLCEQLVITYIKIFPLFPLRPQHPPSSLLHTEILQGHPKK